MKSVRARLLLVVLVAVVPALIAAFTRARDSRNDLMRRIDRRLARADSTFGAEIEEDQSCSMLGARAASFDPRFARAIREQRPGQTREAILRLGAVYTDTLIVLANKKGFVLASSDPRRIPKTLATAELAGVPRGEEVEAFTALTLGTSEGYSLVAAVPIRDDDEVVGSLAFITPIDSDYLEHVEDKVGADLALKIDDKLVAFCKDHAAPMLEAHGGGHVTLEKNGKSIALATFDPKGLPLAGHEVELTASSDITQMMADSRHSLLMNLAWILGAMVVAGAIAMWLAAQISDAVRKLSAASESVRAGHLVHAEPITTGDELESLAGNFNRMVDGLKEAERVKATFGKYMARKVFERILQNKPELGQGELIRVSVLFSDIRGFTTMSEKMEPRELLSFLNTYFTGMVDSVLRNNGVVDKFIGDAIMAVFGAPEPGKDDALNAVRAAIEMRSRLGKLNEEFRSKGMPEIKTGIGIHTGPVVAGNMGHHDRMEYAVIGDAVNLASRLETMTKEMGVDVLISEDTYLAIKDQIEAEPLRKIKVKGRAQEVMVYRLVSLTGEIRKP